MTSKQPILKKFEQKSSKQLPLIKFTKKYEYTKIFSCAIIGLSRKNCYLKKNLTFYRLTIFFLLIHHFFDFHGLQEFFNCSFKGCVHYLNRCTTYILCQVNEKKMSLQSLMSSFTINIVIFKKGACQQSVSFLQATLCL